MEAVVHVPEPRFEHVCVDLRRRQIRMAEHGLNGAQVGAALEEMGGERMAEDVRAEMGANTRSLPLCLQDLPAADARQARAPARVHEQPRALPAARERGAAVLNVSADRERRGLPQRDNALLAALAEALQIALVRS